MERRGYYRISRKQKMAKVLKITVDACIDSSEIYDLDSLVQDLYGEVTKVKSGLYENLLSGNITGVEIVGEAEDWLDKEEEEDAAGGTIEPVSSIV
jgi:hypothetical protein